jgi:hypothetical protein
LIVRQYFRTYHDGLDNRILSFDNKSPIFDNTLSNVDNKIGTSDNKWNPIVIEPVNNCGMKRGWKHFREMMTSYVSLFKDLNEKGQMNGLKGVNWGD